MAYDCSVFIFIIITVASLVVNSLMVTYAVGNVNVTNSSCVLTGTGHEPVKMTTWAIDMGVTQIMFDVLPLLSLIMSLVGACMTACCYSCGGITALVFGVIFLITLIAGMICDVVSAIYGIVMVASMPSECIENQRSLFVIVCIFAGWHILVLLRIIAYVRIKKTTIKKGDGYSAV